MVPKKEDLNGLVTSWSERGRATQLALFLDITNKSFCCLSLFIVNCRNLSLFIASSYSLLIMGVFFLKNLSFSMRMMADISAVNSYRLQWEEKAGALGKAKLEAMRSLGAFESIGSSNRIEGNTLSDAEVEKLLSGLSMSSFRSRDEEEIAGYADALNIIQRNYESIPLTENYIKQLHAVLLKYSKHDERHRDEYKTLSDSVAAFDGDGNEVGIVFHTAEPYETPILMENLVNETNELLNDKTFEPLIVIALFIVHFLAIHPFQDGNGRMSRLLTMLLLLKCGYAYVPYYSLEKLIEESKSSYYQGLRRTQLSFSSDKADYSPWLEYFLDILRLQTENLEKKIEAYVSDHSLSMNEESVVSVLKEGGQSFAAICSKLPDLKPNTVKGILRKLCAAGIAEKHGVNKGTWYGIRRK